MLNAERPPPLHVVAEVARLAALRSYQVLDHTLPGLDTLAALAATAMTCPKAVIALVESERVSFGGTFGITGREHQRPGSFYTHVLAEPGALVVRDAAADARFRAVTDFTGFGPIRFCAGVPLEDEDGYRLGALCVFDDEPGEADHNAMLALSRVAALTVGALSDHRDALPTYAHIIPPGPDRVQGWLGVRTKSAPHLHPASRPGLLVISVAADSPAERAGVQTADLLTAIDGRALRHASDVVAALADRLVDSYAKLQLLRGGQHIERMIPVEPERAARSAMRALVG